MLQYLYSDIQAYKSNNNPTLEKKILNKMELLTFELENFSLQIENQDVNDNVPLMQSFDHFTKKMEEMKSEFNQLCKNQPKISVFNTNVDLHKILDKAQQIQIFDLESSLKRKGHRGLGR